MRSRRGSPPRHEGRLKVDKVLAALPFEVALTAVLMDRADKILLEALMGSCRSL